MAVDSVHISASTGMSTMDEEDKSKDDSGKKPISTKKRVVAVPHYLRASTGSCHDSCKYGKPHVFKEKPWRAVARMSAPQPDSAKSVDIQIFVDRTVKKTVEVDNLEPRLPNEAPAANDKLRRSYPSPRKSPVHDFSKSVKEEAGPFLKSPSQAPKVMKKAVRSPGRLPLPDMSKLSKQEGRSASKEDTLSNANTPMTPTIRSASALKKDALSKARPLTPTLRSVSVSKRDALSKATPLTPKVRSVSSGPVRPRSAGGPSLSPDGFAGLRSKPSAETNFSDLPRSSRIAVRNVLITPSATTLSVKRSPKVDVKKPMDSAAALSLLHSSGVRAVKSSNNIRRTYGLGQKDQAKRSPVSAKNQIVINKAEMKHSINETVEEKTLHMIETKDDCLPTAPIANHFIQSPSPLSPESLNSSSQANSLSFTSHEVDDHCELDMESTDSEAEADSKAVYCSEQYKRNARNSVEDRDPKSLKLKFRRGKVVELKSETNSPRRLRFKQGGILGNDQVANSGSRRKSFRKRAVDSDEKEVDTNPEKVALKHQEVSKRDEQVLYNNVIEETASKLVEKRKSKVKALVGAFETVISLQERKPAAPNR